MNGFLVEKRVCKRGWEVYPQIFHRPSHPQQPIKICIDEDKPCHFLSDNLFLTIRNSPKGWVYEERDKRGWEEKNEDSGRGAYFRPYFKRPILLPFAVPSYVYFHHLLYLVSRSSYPSFIYPSHHIHSRIR